MHKPDDALTSDCILHFHTAVLLLFLLYSCTHLGCVFDSSCLRWPHAFWPKINEIYKREILGVSKETGPVLDPSTLATNILNRCRKKFRQFVWKMSEKKKKKKKSVVKRYSLTRKRKSSQKISENFCIIITFLQPEHFLK